MHWLTKYITPLWWPVKEQVDGWSPTHEHLASCLSTDAHPAWPKTSLTSALILSAEVPPPPFRPVLGTSSPGEEQGATGVKVSLALTRVPAALWPQQHPHKWPAGGRGVHTAGLSLILSKVTAVPERGRGGFACCRHRFWFEDGKDSLMETHPPS